jgi:hypothetical protein
MLWVAIPEEAIYQDHGARAQEHQVWLAEQCSA